MGDKLKDLYKTLKHRYNNFSHIISKISSKMSEEILLNEEEFNDFQISLKELKNSQDELFEIISEYCDSIYNLSDIEKIIDQSNFNYEKKALLEKLELLRSSTVQDCINSFKNEILNKDTTEENLKIIQANNKFIDAYLDNSDNLESVINSVSDASLINPHISMGLIFKTITISDKNIDLVPRDLLTENLVDDNTLENKGEIIADNNVELVETIDNCVLDGTDDYNTDNEVINIDNDDSTYEKLSNTIEEKVNIEDKYHIDAIELLKKKGFCLVSTSIDAEKEIKKEKKSFNKSSFSKSIPGSLSNSYARILEQLYIYSYIVESNIDSKNDLFVLRTLFNDGYLARYQINNETYIYFLTKIGCEIYSVSQVKSLIKRVTKTTILDSEFGYKDYYNKDKEKLESDFAYYRLLESIKLHVNSDFSSTNNPFHMLIAGKDNNKILFIITSDSNYIYGDFEVFNKIEKVSNVVCIVKNGCDAIKVVDFFKEYFDVNIYYALYDNLNSFILDNAEYTIENLYCINTDKIDEDKQITYSEDEEDILDTDTENFVDEDVANIELLEENKQKLIESLIIRVPLKVIDQIDFANSTTSSIAKNIKESNDYSFENMYCLIEKLLEENKLFTALELLKALSINDNKYIHLYNVLKCALGKTTQNYDSSMLTKYFACIYENTSDLNISCFVSTMFRILFSPTNIYDYEFKTWYNQLNNLDTNLQFYSKIKTIASILNTVITKIDKRGFSTSNLRQFKLNEDLHSERDLIIEKATKIKNHKTKFSFPDKGLFSYALGEKSRIFECIKWICLNDVSKIEKIEETYNKFVSNSIIDDELIRNYIRENNSKIQNPHILTYTNEKEAIRETKHRLTILEEWINFNYNNEIVNNDDLKLAKQGLFDAVKEYLDNISPCSENNIIKYTLDSIIEQFSDQVSNYNDVKEFLLTDYIVLDDYLTVYEKDLPHYSLVNRIIDHIIENGDAKVNLKTITDKLEYDLNENENLGFVYSLKSYIESNKLKVNFDFSEIDNYRESYDKQIKDGFDEIINTTNLDIMYGRISEEDSQNLYSEIEIAKEFFDNTFNLGLFRKYKKILENHKKQLMISIHNDYCNRLLNLIEDKSLDEYAIINDIYKVIKENNYTVADEYLALLENGQKDLNKELTSSEDFFGEFNRIYDSLYHLLENPNIKGRNINGNDYLLDQLTKIAKNELNIERRRKTTTQAANLLNCWVKNSEMFEKSNELVKKIFEELQFDVDQISNGKSKKEYKYKDVKLRKIGKQLIDYFHPISDFGTNIPDNIPVVYLEGNYSAKMINNSFTKEFKHEGYTIVLLNGYLSKIERNKLAHEFKTNGGLLYKYIVIDRVLFCFLAMIEKSERQRAFINCALPYSYAQPFVENGAGRIPDEMFFGRSQELHSIMDIEKGAILVYGGRQLGKTALLQRVQNLMMKHEDKSYTIYLSIQTIKTSDELLKSLLGEILFLNSKFNKTIILSESKSKSIKNWSDFSGAIRLSYSRGDFKKLYILLDEVDKFIQEQENEGYNVINELIKLKDDSSLHGKFKFVLAGLHNVVKYVHKDNDSLRKLGAPLCVKPLSTIDAKRFITEPLSTIGYKFSNEENQISMILSKLNYYPGLLHIFCSKIITDTNTNFRQYYNNAEKVPPYLIDEKTLGKFLTNSEINTEVNKRLTMTLDLNGSLYLKIACAISYLYEYDNKKPGISINDLGYFFNPQTSNDKIKALLEEMIELGVIRKFTIDNKNLYFYRKYSFHKSVLEQKSNVDELLETAMTHYEV